MTSMDSVLNDVSQRLRRIQADRRGTTELLYEVLSKADEYRDAIAELDTLEAQYEALVALVSTTEGESDAAS